MCIILQLTAEIYLMRKSNYETKVKKVNIQKHQTAPVLGQSMRMFTLFENKALGEHIANYYLKLIN